MQVCFIIVTSIAIRMDNYCYNYLSSGIGAKENFSLGVQVVGMSCHGNFGPAKKLVWGTKVGGIPVRVDQFVLNTLVPP